MNSNFEVKEKGNRSPQQTLVANSSGGGIAGTLDANYFKGQGEREGIEREFIVIARKGRVDNS